jgi:hypothetical protein
MVTFAIESPAISQICTTWKNQKSARGCPRLFYNDRIRYRNYGIIGREQPPECIEAMADRLDGASSA